VIAVASGSDEWQTVQSVSPCLRPTSSLTGANVTMTARYLNVKDDDLQELIERKPLVIAKR
jgi:hypothetical protein